MTHWTGIKPKVNVFSWNKNIGMRFIKKNSGVCTCGGNAPGINYGLKVLQETVQQPLLYFQDGFKGLNEDNYKKELIIESEYGSAIGLSREKLNVEKAIETLLRRGITNLYVFGGNGSVCASYLLHEMIEEYKLPICVNVIPTTIDNDIENVQNTIGFKTSVKICSDIIDIAKEEAKSYKQIALVELMGRESGFIAVHASYESNNVDCLLIPEKNVSISVLVDTVREIYYKQGYVVCVIAEGCRHDLRVLSAYFDNVKIFEPGYMCRNGQTIEKEYIKNMVRRCVYISEYGWGGFIMSELNEKPVIVPLHRCALAIKNVPSDYYLMPYVPMIYES